jgi:hypothetical protein
MPEQNIQQVLMERDGLSALEAAQLIEDAREDLAQKLEQGEMPDDICEEWFGLEPDYIMELL